MTTASGLSPRGSCYGYEVRSELEFRYLRSGGGDSLEIRAAAPPDRPPGELLLEWHPPRFPTHARLHADGDGYRLWIDDAGWFGVDPRAARLLVPPGGDPVRREERIWGLPILLCFLERGDLPLHASCVELDGRALVIAGPRRFGKTTLAASFAEAGCRVLAEDLACLRLGPEPAVIPGPAMLRVRRDVADAFRVAGAAVVGRDADRTHLSLGASRGTCDPVRLGGIVLLNSADTEPQLERVTGADVVRDLWSVSFNLPTEADRARSFRAVGDLASRVTTWKLARRLRLEDIGPTMEYLVEAVSSEA